MGGSPDFEILYRAPLVAMAQNRKQKQVTYGDPVTLYYQLCSITRKLIQAFKLHRATTEN